MHLEAARRTQAWLALTAAIIKLGLKSDLQISRSHRHQIRPAQNRP
jgi:hypothetical protein